MQIFGLASHAPSGSDAVAMFTSGDRSNGVIIATGNQKHRPRGAAVGGTIIYDTSGTTITLDAAGNVTINCTGKVRMVTPRLEVTGDIVAGCDSTHVSVLNHRDQGQHRNSDGNLSSGGAAANNAPVGLESAGLPIIVGYRTCRPFASPSTAKDGIQPLPGRGHDDLGRHDPLAAARAPFRRRPGPLGQHRRAR